jgi:arginyl-tRNA synthetase
VQSVIPPILKDRETWGGNPSLGLKNEENPSEGRKRIVIEFSSPNIAKPFHAGHLRSTIIGGFLGNLHEAAGWDVVRMNYVGDWGKQYGLLALGYQMFGDEKELELDPINHLFQVYVKINQKLAAEKDEIKTLEAAGKDSSDLKQKGLDEQARKYFKAMCEHEPKAIEMWTRFRNLSIKKYKEAYARLNIHFDEYSGESQVTEESMKEVEQQLTDKKLLSESEGATVVDFTQHVAGKAGKTLGVALIRKQDGTSLYLTRDCGAIFARQQKYQFDKMIYVVASDQDRHLKQLFKIVEMTGHKELESKLVHVNFGLVLGMSTRRGTVVFLDDVLREVRDHMHEVMKKNEEKYAQVTDPEGTADILGISSVMVQDMSGKR